MAGIAKEDVDFFRNIYTNKIPIVIKDDLIVVHMKHDHKMLDNRKLLDINKAYYFKKWGDIK